MKYLKVIVSLALIPFGMLIGSLIGIGGGSLVIFGAVLGGILCYILMYKVHWPGIASPNEAFLLNNVDKESIDKTIKSIQEAHIEDEIRFGGRRFEHRS